MIQWGGGWVGGENVPTAPDFVVRRDIQAYGTDADTETYFTLDAVFDESVGRYYLKEFSARAAGPSTEITGAALRNIKVQSLLRDAISGMVQIEFEGGGHFDVENIAAARDEITSAGPSSSEAMLAVARVYRAAQIASERPAKAVQDVLGLTQPTATLWIRRARDLGLLGTYSEAPTDG